MTFKVQQIFGIPMKIKLASTLPFTPVQLDNRHESPRRAVGQLQGIKGDREFCIPVYEYQYGIDDVIHYRIDPTERVYLDQRHDLPVNAANDGELRNEQSLIWIEHDDTLNYKPYAFLVMNAMTRLVGDWDGIVYRTPSGERLRESAWHATLQVVDACVCSQTGLWAMVQLSAETSDLANAKTCAFSQLGWVRLG